VAIAAMRQVDEVVSRVGGNRLVHEFSVLGWGFRSIVNARIAPT
jgi:hypothetical protein